MLLLASVLFGLWLAKPAKATAPTTEEAIIKSIYGPTVPTNYQKEKTVSPVGNTTRRDRRQSLPTEYSGRHSTRAEKTISEDKLRAYLRQKDSPLFDYAGNILDSPYWSTIIGICTIEQYGCTKAPGNNCWGIMAGQSLAQYKDVPTALEAISNLLSRYEARGYDTVEELNCYYVQPCSSNWLNTVLKTKSLIESL